MEKPEFTLEEYTLIAQMAWSSNAKGTSELFAKVSNYVVAVKTGKVLSEPVR